MLPPGVLRLHAFACWTLIVLGVAHGTGTLIDVFVPTFFAPQNASLLAEMRVTPTRLSTWVGAERMTVWPLHLGMNLSMSLGFFFTGAVQLLVRRVNPQLLAASPIVPLATLLSLSWVVIAATCWYWMPLLGFVIATLGLARTWYALRAVAPPVHIPPVDARLFGIAALGMGVAGLLHILGTASDLFTHGAFSPTAPELRQALEQTNITLAAMVGSALAFWTASVGFHFSHGVSVIGFALFGWYMARDLPGVLARDRALQLLFVTASALWLAMSVAFWFYGPIAVTAMALIGQVAFILRAGRVRLRRATSGERQELVSP